MGEVWARAFKHQALRLVLIWLATFATSPFPAFGERLAVKAYTMADGLPRNDIRCIRRDSRGFLWFCTGEGLSRFDGYTFTNYGVEQGLPDPGVTDFIESRSGDYWVATANGLCRFNPKPPQGSPGSLLGQDASRRPMFEVFRPGTELNRELIPSRGERFDLIAQDVGRAPVDVLLVDHEGALWIATQQNLLRRRPDGQMERYTQRDGLPGGPTHNLRINDLLEDRKGHLWVATWSGLCRLAAHSKPGQPLVERVYTSADGLPHDQVTSLFQSLDGQVWVGTHNGLAELIPGDGNRRERFRSYMTAQGFTLPGVDNLAVNALAQDGAANLWLGTEAGALRLERNGFTTYTVRDGLASDAISSIFEDQHGHLCVGSVSYPLNPRCLRASSISPGARAKSTSRTIPAPGGWLPATVFAGIRRSSGRKTLLVLSPKLFTRRRMVCRAMTSFGFTKTRGATCGFPSWVRTASPGGRARTGRSAPIPRMRKAGRSVRPFHFVRIARAISGWASSGLVWPVTATADSRSLRTRTNYRQAPSFQSTRITRGGSGWPPAGVGCCGLTIPMATRLDL